MGNDKSRTWILTLGEKGLRSNTITGILMEHPIGLGLRWLGSGEWYALPATLPADPYTVKLIPEAATNVWTLQIILRSSSSCTTWTQQQPRYRAYLSLKNPSPAQQNQNTSLHQLIH